MSADVCREPRKISEAVREGLLVDVSAEAWETGIPHRTFISKTLLAKHLAADPNRLGLLLGIVGTCHELSSGYELLGPSISGDEVSILEPHGEYGHVLLILEADRLDEFNLERTTGEEPEYLM